MKKNNRKHRSAFIGTIKKKAKDGTLKSIWKDWLWIWSFSRNRKKAVVLYTLFGIGSVGLGLVASVVSKYMFDAIYTTQLQPLLTYSVLMVISAAAAILFQSFTSRFSAKLAIGMHNDVQAKVFDDILDTDWTALSQYPTGDLLSRFSTDVSTVSSCAISWLPNVIIQLFTVLATLGVILFYDPWMALIGCATTPVLFLMSRNLLSKQHTHNRNIRQVGGQMSAFQSEAFHNMDTLKGFGVEGQVRKKLHFWQSSYEKTILDHNLFSIRTNVWMTILSDLVQYGALAYCLWRLWRGDILLGTMTLFLQQRSNLTSAFSSLISLIPTALSGSVAAERVRELTQLPKEPRNNARITVSGSCSVNLENVRVAYTPDRKVLSHVNIHVPAGSTVALVGPSGEGKTTLLRLLLGLIRPEDGQIYLEDSDNNRYPLGADTRHCFSYVPQGNTVIAGTVAENLRLGKEDASDEELQAALEAACAWEFVEELPQGMDTPIGEGGKGLSEGQAQRLSIARALIRKAPVMLLDEVTSALDKDTEQKVLENLTARGVTTLLTTHRLTVLDRCARVYRVEDGQVEIEAQ